MESKKNVTEAKKIVQDRIMSWETYFQKNKDRGLRPLYQRAIDRFDLEARVALDLGCGVGTETVDLLKRGFEVHAIDVEFQSILYVKDKAKFSRHLHAEVTGMEDLRRWPPVTFLYAYHSFPFCLPDLFDGSLSRALKSIQPGGWFVAAFFGMEDEWVKSGKAVGITQEALAKKLTGFKVHELTEVRDGVHSIEVIAQKL